MLHSDLLIISPALFPIPADQAPGTAMTFHQYPALIRTSVRPGDILETPETTINCQAGPDGGFRRRGSFPNIKGVCNMTAFPDK
ncbi:hypothetical protein TgHK011_008131 [Trichoderma gracile]|nr:hypothetical protein TgHK011_008131 [Trichoderma gracile]